SGHRFHFSLLVAAGRPPIESAAGGRRYRMAHTERAANSGDAFASPQRSVFFHHAGSTMVCLGVALRIGAGNSVSGLRVEWSGVALRLGGGCVLCTAAWAIATAWNRSAAGNRADAAGGRRGDGSSVRPAPH